MTTFKKKQSFLPSALRKGIKLETGLITVGAYKSQVIGREGGKLKNEP
jgi:hypothetical protein